MSLSDQMPGSTGAAFLDGFRAAATSIFFWTIFGNYVGFGALAHDLGFTLGEIRQALAATRRSVFTVFVKEFPAT